MKIVLWSTLAAAGDPALQEGLRAHRPREVHAPLDALRQYQEVLRQADLLLVVVRQPDEADWLALESAASCVPAAGVVLLSEPLSAPQLHRAMRAGVRLALDWPIGPANLREEMARIADQLSRGGTPSGRVMTFCSGGGGSGVSLVAANFAASCAAQRQERVLLFDLCQGFANSHLYLTPQPPERNVLDLCSHSVRLDPALFAAGVHNVLPDFDLLPSPPDPVAAGDMTAPQIEAILALACQLYDLVVIDIGQRLSPLSMQALDSSERVGVVLNASLQHLSTAHRLCETLLGLGVARDQVSLWLNQYDARRAVLSPEVFRQKLGFEPVLVLPSDPKPVALSVLQGRPLVAAAGQCALSKALRSAVAQIWPQPVFAAPQAKRFRLPFQFARR